MAGFRYKANSLLGNMKKTLLIVLGSLSLFTSCKKDVTVPNNGIYRGVFLEVSDAGDTLNSGITFMAVYEKELKFSMVRDTTTNAPASHSGSYLVDNANSMEFTNESPVTADPDHYLDTVYNYNFDDVNFNFWQSWGGKTYSYSLTRN